MAWLVVDYKAGRRRQQACQLICVLGELLNPRRRLLLMGFGDRLQQRFGRIQTAVSKAAQSRDGNKRSAMGLAPRGGRVHPSAAPVGQPALRDSHLGEAFGAENVIGTPSRRDGNGLQRAKLAHVGMELRSEVTPLFLGPFQDVHPMMDATSPQDGALAPGGGGQLTYSIRVRHEQARILAIRRQQVRGRPAAASRARGVGHAVVACATSSSSRRSTCSWLRLIASSAALASISAMLPVMPPVLDRD